MIVCLLRPGGRSECVLPPASTTAFHASPASTSAPASLGLDLRMWLFVLALGSCLGGLFHPPTLPKISSGSIDSAISATSFKVSGPVTYLACTLHAPCMLRLLSLRLACGSSSAQVQSDRGLETRLSRLPPELPPECEPPPPQAFVGSVESTFLRRSKRPSEVPDWSHLLWQRRLASRPPGSSVWHASI